MFASISYGSSRLRQINICSTCLGHADPQLLRVLIDSRYRPSIRPLSTTSIRCQTGENGAGHKNNGEDVRKGEDGNAVEHGDTESQGLNSDGSGSKKNLDLKISRNKSVLNRLRAAMLAKEGGKVTVEITAPKSKSSKSRGPESKPEKAEGSEAASLPNASEGLHGEKKISTGQSSGNQDGSANIVPLTRRSRAKSKRALREKAKSQKRALRESGSPEVTDDATKAAGEEASTAPGEIANGVVSEGGEITTKKHKTTTLTGKPRKAPNETAVISPDESISSETTKVGAEKSKPSKKSSKKTGAPSSPHFKKQPRKSAKGSPKVRLVSSRKGMINPTDSPSIQKLYSATVPNITGKRELDKLLSDLKAYNHAEFVVGKALESAVLAGKFSPEDLGRALELLERLPRPERMPQLATLETALSKTKLDDPITGGGSEEATQSQAIPVAKKAKKAKEKAGSVEKHSRNGTADTPPKLKARSKRGKNSQIETIEAETLHLTPINIEKNDVPRLSYGLDRVLFNPGVYHLQDPRTRVFNFDPYLETIMPVQEFDFSALKQYITSSRDTTLLSIARDEKKKYTGSTSSMTSALAHFHFLLSQFRLPNFEALPRGFPIEFQNFTVLQRSPSAVFLRWRNGTYAIDADKQFDTANILSMLGKSMEKLLTLSKDDFERYRRENSSQISEEERNEAEPFHYTTMGDFLMRSQLDAYDPRLPGTGMFDLKTRAVVSIRIDTSQYQETSGYEIRQRNGKWESFEREYFDMIRSAFLKYSLQVRMGRMDGIFVAYHNTERIFGFQYISLQEMDLALHGTENLALGDTEFKLSVDLLNRVLDKATAKFPEQSLRLFFETRESKTSDFMYIFAEPVEEKKIEEIQQTNRAQIEEFEQSVLGLSNSELKEEMQEEEENTDWETIRAGMEEVIRRDELGREIEEDESTEDADKSDEFVEGAQDDDSNLTKEEEKELKEILSKAFVDSGDSPEVEEDEEVGDDEETQEPEEEQEGEGKGTQLEQEEDIELLLKDAAVEILEEAIDVDQYAEVSNGINNIDRNVKDNEEVLEDSENGIPDHEEDPPTEEELAEYDEQIVEGEEVPADETDNDLKGPQFRASEASEATLVESEDLKPSEDDHDLTTDSVVATDFGIPPVGSKAHNNPDGPLLVMTLTIRNKHNGEYVKRPLTLGKKDKWDVEYALDEIESETRGRALYDAVKSRRRKVFSKDASDKKNDVFKDKLVNTLKTMSQQGRAWRKKQQDGPKVVFGQPEPGDEKE